MPLGSGSAVVRKLESIYPLDDEDRTAIAALPFQLTNLRADQDIVREGDRTTRSCILLTGMACWFKVTGDGKRQILSFQIPGDLPDLQTIHLERLDSSLSTITPCRLAFVQHEVLRDLCDRRPAVAAAFWRTTLIDAAIYREWVMNVGGRQAYSRIAHVMCEMMVRLDAVRLADGHVCDFPITQGELADATGLSTVHVNRSIQQLRQNKLISLKGTSLTVLDWSALQAAGDFDAAYLHLNRPAAKNSTSIN